MMTYKNCEKLYIGSSDVATLVLVGLSPETELIKSEILHFGGDGSYAAYVVVGDDVEIGAHYTKVASFCEWLRVYDDRERTAKFGGNEINVYRAGDYGCIIQCIGGPEYRTCGPQR